MNNKRSELLWMAFFTILFTIMYVSLIFNKNVWTDEAYTIELIRENGFAGIIRNTANDVHPPLYYLIVKVSVLVFGDAFPVYKMVSVVPMVLVMLLAFSHIRPWWGTQAAVLFLIMVNAIPCVLEYAVQIRMYSWALFFVTWAGIGACGMCLRAESGDGKRCGIQLTIAGILACYTHTYAMLGCVCIYMVLCVWALVHGRQRRNYSLLVSCVISGVIVAVCYLPWFFVLLGQTRSRIENYWIEPVTWEVVRKYPDFLFASELPGSTLMFLILCVAAVLVCIRRRKDGGLALMMLAVPLMTAAAGIAVSVLVTPFFIARYLLPCMGLLALVLALAFRVEKDDKRAVPILLGIFGMLMVLYSYQNNVRAEYHSTHTDELLSYMEEHLQPEDLIVYNYEIYGFIYEIYFADRTVFLSDVDFGGDFGSIWYFDSCVTPWLDGQVLEQNHLEKEFIMTTGIEQNEFQLYRIRHREGAEGGAS